MITEIQKEVTVEASQEKAFNVFTQNINFWWPKSYHVGSCPMTEIILECREDGRWYSRHEDGSEVNVGKVLLWNPNSNLILAWQIDGDFKYDPDLVSEVEVRFTPQGHDLTYVAFEHRNLDKLSGGSKVIESMDEGWGLIMNLFKAVADEA